MEDRAGEEARPNERTDEGAALETLTLTLDECGRAGARGVSPAPGLSGLTASAADSAVGLASARSAYSLERTRVAFPSTAAVLTSKQIEAIAPAV
jgi:hypothetical protein